MGKEIMNCVSISAVESKLERRQPTKRDLRLENLDLRRRLEEAEEEARSHTVMMREADHRIKNSLQVVSSLISLQARRETTGSTRNALRGAAERVRSIARIHDALQATSGSGSVDIGDILNTMGGSLQRMAGEEGRIAVTVAAEAMQIPVETAQPMVLAVNELVINALRHAFPDERRGKVHINLTNGRDAICITVADDGVGLPADYSGGQGYGMNLINLVTKQVNGVLHVSSGGGARFSISAPIRTALSG